MSSLAGSLLIAHPSMSDPRFHRTVILLTDHNVKTGSFGLVINRPTGKLYGGLVPDKPLGHLARVPVLHGGPVQSDQLIFAAFRWHSSTNQLECRHLLSVAEAEELAAAQHHTVRAFFGYAGWSGGQLEGELAQRAWLVRKPDQEELLESERAPRVWRELTSTFGPWFKMVAEAPEDPTLN
jgi:putative transcriptional regulator